jgi:hypothetical protein
MPNVTATTPEVSREIRDKLRYWVEKATALGAATQQDDNSTEIILSGDAGACRVTVPYAAQAEDEDMFRVEWHSLTSFPEQIQVHPRMVLAADGGSTDLQPLEFSGGEVLRDMLEPGTVEVATPVQTLYGFVVNNRVAAVTYTTDAHEASRTDRAKLGFNEHTYVVEPDDYGALVQPALTRAAWYDQFWKLADKGAVVALSDRVNSYPDKVWLRSYGDRAWLEFLGTDWKSPRIPSGQRYFRWQVTSNTPAQYVGEPVEHNLRGWFL